MQKEAKIIGRTCGGLYTVPHDLLDFIGFHQSLLESTRLVTQTFSVSHRPDWHVQSSVVHWNMPCSSGLPGLVLDFSTNQFHWTPADSPDSSDLQQIHWSPPESGGFHWTPAELIWHPYLIINKKITWHLKMSNTKVRICNPIAC